MCVYVHTHVYVDSLQLDRASLKAATDSSNALSMDWDCASASIQSGQTSSGGSFKTIYLIGKER